MSEPAAVWVPIKELRPWVKNPRKNDGAVVKCANSIIRFGFGAPLLARKANGEIIAGHTRLKASLTLRKRWAEEEDDDRDKWHQEAIAIARGGPLPVRYRDLSEREAHLLALADNKIGELAEWSDDLPNMVADLTFAEAAAAGWDWKELAEFAKDDEDGDASPQLGDGLTYSVVVECADETQQAELLERLELEGYSCKPLVS